MKKTLLVAGVACLTAISALSNAEGYRKVAGSYMVTSRNVVDPASDAKKDRVAFFIEGDAARDIFNQMIATAKKNACSSDLRTKSAGGLKCSKNLASNDYQCTLGVMLKTGVVVDVSAC